MRSQAMVLAVCAAMAAAGAPGSDLPRVAIDPAKVDVSGISSGAYMAGQMHIAFSKTLRGAGLLAGGPYWCSMDLVGVAVTSCMSNPEFIDVGYLQHIAQATAISGFIDDLSHLSEDRVWIMSALNDTVVETGVVHKAGQFYTPFLRDPASQLKGVWDVDGEHSQITDSYGSLCDFLGEPYINNCGFDAAGSALQHLASGTLTPPSNASRGAGDQGYKPQGQLVTFSQAAYFGGSVGAYALGMGGAGFVYVPRGCAGGSKACALHVAFHGCEMDSTLIGQQYVLNGGYLPWADANDIVVLFPQAQGNPITNPKGCWDWFGVDGPAFASRLGSQTLAVKWFMDGLMGQPLTPNSTATPHEVDGAFRQLHADAKKTYVAQH